MVRLTAFFVLLFLVSGCVSYGPHRYYRIRPKARSYFYQGYEERGIASWYGADFNGKRTASGEIYNMYASTAANKTLPLGTYVKVRNLDNGLSTVVKINDRGPFVRGRIIDLSYKAAKAIDMVGPGTAPVIIKVVGGNYNEPERFTLQVGAFSIIENAVRLKKRLQVSFDNVSMRKVYQDGIYLYKVYVGNFASPNQSAVIKKMLLTLGHFSFLTVR